MGRENGSYNANAVGQCNFKTSLAKLPPSTLAGGNATPDSASKLPRLLRKLRQRSTQGPSGQWTLYLLDMAII